MKKFKIFNIFLILIITCYSIPINVFAESQCYEGMPSDYGIITCETTLVSQANGWAWLAIGGVVGGIVGGILDATDTNLRTINMKWTICSNGNGTMKVNRKFTDSANDFKIEEDEFVESFSTFNDSSTGMGKCPDVLFGNINKETGKDEIRVSYDKKSYPVYYYDDHDFTAYVLETYNNRKVWSDGFVVETVPEEMDCESLLGSKDDPESLAYLIDRFLLYFKIAAPILVLLFSTVDFVKTIIVNDEETMKKVQKRLITRIIYAILLFVLPTFLGLLLDIFGFTASNCL